MFKFLKLRNSDSGDARRHVPFASIIHKPLFLIFAFIFSFICVVPVKVSALADPVPQFNVINGTDLNTFIGGYSSASSDIQWITNALIGAQALEYGGLGNYATRFNQLPDDADVWDRIVLIGEKITDDLMSPYVAADRAFSKIIDYAQGALNFARGFVSQAAFLAHVNSLSNFYLEYSPEFGSQLNQFFAVNGGLYNWQTSVSDWDSGFIYQQRTLSGTLQNEYNLALSNITQPRMFANSNWYSDSSNWGVGNIVFGPSFQFDLFINTTSHTVNSLFDSFPSFDVVGVRFDYNQVISGSVNTNVTPFSGLSVNYNPSSFSTYNDIANYYLSSTNGLFTLYNSNWFNTGISFVMQFPYSALVRNVYVGPSREDAVLIQNLSDLGFSDTDSLQVLNPVPGSDFMFDLKAMIEEIVQAQPDPALELPLKPIIYNVTQVNGSPLTAEDLEGISFNVTPPESGIDIPLDVFAPFFDNGKGFISYMWYMTKPLVMYTRSFLDAITFDPVDGFNASGPGYFILGVAALGLIGGVIVKFLL